VAALMLLPVRRADRLSARLGPAIRRSRRQAGLSQCELADLLSVGQSSVSKWERGTTDPAVGLFLQMVRLFGPSLLAMVFQAAGYGDGASGEREGDCRRGDAAGEGGEELAALVAKGLTDAQIAERYRVRVKTVVRWRRTYQIRRQTPP